MAAARIGAASAAANDQRAHQDQNAAFALLCAIALLIHTDSKPFRDTLSADNRAETASLATLAALAL